MCSISAHHRRRRPASGAGRSAVIAAPREVLRVAGVSAGYRKVTVLHDIDVVLHERDTLALVGAGKTLLSAIMGQIPVTSGSIVFAGEALTRLGDTPNKMCHTIVSGARLRVGATSGDVPAGLI
jgi:ABC-type transporter Mla maintaining outer membrane lipid asymmetry ATPase subunit MlaF